MQARGVDRAQPELTAAGVEESLQVGVRTPSGQMGTSVGSYGTLAGRRFSCSGISALAGGTAPTVCEALLA